MRGALAAAVLASLLVTPAIAQRGITPMDVMKLRHVTGVYPNPKTGTVVFTRTEPRPPGEVGGSRTHLWALDGDNERLLLGDKKSVGGVAWHPGGELLTVLHKGDGDEHTEVYAVSTEGELAKVTDTPHGVSAYQWRPDGNALAYTVTDPQAEVTAEARKLGFRQKVVDEDFRHTSLWLWDRESGDSRRLTEGVTVFNFNWAPTGTHLAVGTAPSSLVDDRYMFTRLTLVKPGEGTSELLVDNPGKLGDYAWSPDGKTLAYVSAADRRDPHAGTLFAVDLDGAREPRCLTPDFKGMVHNLDWHEGQLWASVSRGVNSELTLIPTAEGQGAAHMPLAFAFQSFEITPSSDPSAEFSCHFVGSTPEHGREVFSLSGGRLTDSNPWLNDIALGKQEVVTYAARDGLEIEGLLIYPVDYQQGTRYPMVIVAHGGPESHFSNGWNTDYGRWGQLLAARGYFAWYPNYRASTGYGVEFAKADHGDPMGSEFEDHLDAIAHFDGEGLIDVDRVGIGGGSYGGYTAAWAATKQSDHFAAAVSFVPFVDIRTKWYTSDIPWEFYYVHYEEKWPHEQMSFLAERSPLTWAPLCRTPLLLLGGTSDTRVHPSQPFMLYRAVKTSTETPVRYVQYPGEGHGNRSNAAQYDYMLRTLRWFDHYLGDGDRREVAPPPFEVDYGDWMAAAEAAAGDEGEGDGAGR